MSTSGKNSDKNSDKNKEGGEKPGIPARLKRFSRWLAPAAAAVVVFLLGAWLAQRALNSTIRQKRFQAWLDENLNADVSLLQSTRLRLNLLRDTRFYVSGLEVEHPTPLFPGKFLTLVGIVARTPFYSFYGLRPGVIDLQIYEPKILLEQGESGEWSTDGLMRPLSTGNADFPYPMPALSGFRANIHDGELVVRRRGFEMRFRFNAELETSGDARRLILRAGSVPFVFRSDATGEEMSGSLRIPVATVLCEFDRGSVNFRPDNTELRIDRLPAAVLPFFFSRLPAEKIPGSFSGLVRFYEDPDGYNRVKFEGNLVDAPLSAFGLPPNAALRMDLPVGDSPVERMASIRLGPSGFGGFDILLPVGGDRSGERLALNSDVVSLEGVVDAFVDRAGLSAWLPGLISSISWNARQWRGYGWEGSNLVMNVTKSAAGLNAFAEGDLLDGKTRAALTLGQGRDTVVTTAAEKMDARQFAARLSKILPEVWRVSLAGDKGNFTWRGTIPGGLSEKAFWDFNVVFSKSVVDTALSGEWWRAIASVPAVVAGALPEWGGGDPAALLALAGVTSFPFEQLSVMSDWDREFGGRVDFVVHREDDDEIRGWIEFPPDGEVRGQAHLLGQSTLIAAIRQANPEFADVVGLLAGTEDGLPVTFRYSEDAGLRLECSFLRDAVRLREELRSAGGESGQ